MPLWYDDRDGEYRGSILKVQPSTMYEVRLTLTGTGISSTIDVDTWKENFPIAQHIELPANSSSTLVITENGSPDGYILYAPPEGQTATITIPNNQANAVRFNNASYVILRDVNISGPTADGILLQGNTHDIVIERCDITNWGAAGIGSGDAGIRANASSVHRVVVQRNKIHHPRGNSNSWADGHPGGPNAIKYRNSTIANHVIRFNECFSDIDHYYLDVMGGGTNYSENGFPGRDSDIYGNYVANCWDDGIESEGGNMNVRIWGNFVEHTYVKFAAATVSLGPLYLFNNVAGTSRKLDTSDNSDQYDRGAFLKCGGRNGFLGGRTYVLHNTILQPDPPPGRSLPLGCKGGIAAHGGDLFNLIARNNIIQRHTGSGAIFTDNTNSCTNDLDYNYYVGTHGNNCGSDPHEQNGMSSNQFVEFASDKIQFSQDTGEFYYPLANNSPASGIGEYIPNVNDMSSPDVGAFQQGDVPMIAGTLAGDNPPPPPPPPSAPAVPSGLTVTGE